MWSFGVPNVPCGVESYILYVYVIFHAVFLMYRVELKVFDVLISVLLLKLFLMYRVELKGFCFCVAWCFTNCS